MAHWTLCEADGVCTVNSHERTGFDINVVG